MQAEQGTDMNDFELAAAVLTKISEAEAEARAILEPLTEEYESSVAEHNKLATELRRLTEVVNAAANRSVSNYNSVVRQIKRAKKEDKKAQLRAQLPALKEAIEATKAAGLRVINTPEIKALEARIKPLKAKIESMQKLRKETYDHISMKHGLY
jgi:hypothetical protein